MARSRAWLEAAVLLALAVALLASTSRFGSAPDLLTQGVSPAFFPRLLLGALIVLAVLLPFERPAESAGRSAGEGSPSRRTGASFGLLLAAALLIPFAGIFPAVGLAAGGLAFLWGERRPGTLLALAVLLQVLLYAVFSLGLGVRFTVGRWFGGG